ncbi:hypothetical protein BUZ49_05270 [Staphylococcus hominis]|uniref:Peptidase S74 domain-containing protein n=2 Tax=Staphylococcus hominis TaxID=1290 RepID=A0A974KZ01_STAHO|nr:hypothetical protein BUZ51_06345 [Staphylococcus hominis]RIO58570.1 hypothetical protein BUZ49_05270 [Staphylococcus hominis]
MTRNVQEMVETLDFTVLSERADNLRERNRVIAQDYNGVYREFIITHVEDDNLEGTTDVKCNASYLEDLATAKPLEPQTFEKMSTTQALLKTLADTGWEVSDETEYGGMRSKSWTSYNNPYQVIGMLETAYDMIADFYIELGSHTVEHRYVSLKHPNSLFKGKEIVKGKDLTGLTRTVDTSEVRTALIALGPEDEKGNRISTIVKDDDAHEQFGLPGRYLWDIYEPESEDTGMTLERLTTLAKTELNKRKQMSVSYEISALDIHKYYDDVQVELRDKVRVKDRDFNPPLYVEAEVLAFTYNLILDDTTFTFGNVVEFEEDTLRQEFTRRLDEIRKKLQDDISNVNTIVNDAVEGQLEYFEPKIIKSDEAPEKPVEDMLWYDTSDPNVAVLRRYVNGEWRNETAKDVEQLGGMTREKVLYNSLTNTFANLNIQHSKLLDEVYKLLNNEYLVDDELRLQLNNATDNVINVYNNIETNLDSMTPETATIGKLIDTQALFVRYRERLQDLYKAMRNAQIAADDRLKLLQSQYTDKKFNDAMNKIAETLPNGRWDSENQRLYADIPNRTDVDNVRQALQEYTDGQISDLNSVLGKEIDSKINTTKSEISANISSVERKIDGIEVGGRNLLPSYSEKYEGVINPVITNTKEFDAKLWARSIYSDTFINSILEVGQEYTLSYDIEILEVSDLKEYVLNVGLILYDWNTKKSIARAYKKLPREVGYKERQTITFTYEEGTYNILAYTNILSTDGTAKGPQFDNDLIKFSNLKLEKGNIATDWTPAPEDLQNEIVVKSQEISKAQADAAETRAQAYADSKITNEEQARIRQADANVELLQQQQKSLKNEMAAYTDNLINEEERARMDADAAKEEALKAEINLAQTQANAYADNKITAEEERAIADAESKLEIAKQDAQTKADAAQEAAKSYALTQAQTAQTQAEAAAKAYAKAQDELKQTETKAYADGIVSDEEKRAIADAIAKRDEAKLYADQKAQEAQEAANQNTINQLKPITTRVTTNEANITELDNQISLMAKSDDVAQKLRNVDERLTPLETTVKSNKATLDILPTQIESKVSKQDYTLDKDNIVQRLNNADSDRIQLANKIEDRVTITEYNNGIDSIKSTNRNYLQSYYSTTQNSISGITKGPYNVTLNKSQRINFYFYDRNNGGNSSLKQDTDYILKIHESSPDIKIGVFYKKGSNIIVSYTTDKVIRFNTSNRADILIVAISQSDEQYIGKISLYEGTKELDWTPAPEDIELLGSIAEANAKAYTDAQDNLRETNIKAYADGIVSDEEKRAIQDAENKLKEAKSHADKTAEIVQQTAQNYTNNEINNLDIGSENLILNSESRSDFSNSNTYSLTRFYLSKQLEIGKHYTFACNFITTDERQSGQTSVYPYNPNGKRDTVDIKDGKIIYTFTARSESTEFLVYKDIAGQSNVDLNVTIEKAILVEGDKVTGWMPANEDVKKDIQQAETNAKNYTDEYKRSNDVAMTKLETSITQNGDKIALKVDEQKFNASRKTLSQVISEISATTKGINLSYDENGNIQSYTMDRNGIKVDGSKIDINQGDVVIQNGVTTIKDAYIDKLFSKNATIQYLNSIDITAKRLQAVDNGANVNIENGSITMTRADKTKLNLGINGISMYNSNGSKRFSIDERLVTSAAIGTSNANVYLGTGSNYEARIVDVSGLPSDGYVDSYRYRPLRASGFYGNFWNINTADTLGDPVNLYARPVSGGELRVVLNGQRSNYQNFRADGIYGNWFDVNQLQGSSSNLFIRPLRDGELRVTESGSTSKYRPVRASHFMLEGEGIGDNTPNNSYMGTNGEWRFTDNNFYNGSNTVYKNIRFAKWYAVSSQKFKYDIKPWNYSVLDAFRNDLQLYSYKHKSEQNDNYIRNHHGVIIEREMPIEWRHGDGIDGNEITFWNTKAIQEIIAIVDEQKGKINELEEEVKWLKTKI